MNKYTILIVDDDEGIVSLLSSALTSGGYNVKLAKSGNEALMCITSYCPDAVLLEPVLSDMDGIDIISSVRRWSQIPIIAVSSGCRETDKIRVLDSGADDYITKPFGTGELLARVRVALRHAHGNRAEAVKTGSCEIGDMIIDYDKRHVFVEGRDVRLTQTEYNLVALLAGFAGKVLTYDYIIKRIWGPNISGDNQILRVNMANIRRKIEKSSSEPRYIFTEVGVGYRMADCTECDKR